MLEKIRTMKGTLYRSQDGIWFVRGVVNSTDTPALEVINDFPLHPYDETDYEYEYTMTRSVGFIPKDIEFEISESRNAISEDDGPPKYITIKYAKLK